MSNASTHPTVTANFAQQSTNSSSSQGVTPPLLPAFLITGLLLAAIVFIIVWRHIIERRNVRREEDPTWPMQSIFDNGGTKPTPTIWDLQVKGVNEQATWEDIMPLSATALRAAPKPRRPRYLIPSDRPVTFFTRMFGGERRPPRPAPPPISVLAPTLALPHVVPSEDDEEEEPIDRLQVAVLISLPHPRRIRHPSFLSEKAKENPDTQPPSAQGDMQSIREELETEDASLSCKGKKRSLESPFSPFSHGYDPKANCDYDGKDGLSEVAFGIAIKPFVER